MNPLNLLRHLMVMSLAVVLAACGGDSDDETPSANCDGSGSVTLSGTITFEDVPVTGSAHLDYSNIEQKPVRLAQLLIECADGSTVFAESTTDEDGNYSVDVPQGVDVRLVVRAASTRSDGPSWDIEVVDNTNDQAVWAVESEAFDTGDGDLEADLVATSGWGGNAYTGDRIGGAFSIYDTVYQAMQLVISAEPDASFEQLTLNWSPNNTSSCSGDELPFADGCTGTSFYTAGQIFILGEEDEDTDEYDDSVIAHEWGHYYEDNFSRADSVGGSHRGGEALDIRVAFGEGWGNALSGMVLDETFYRDTLGNNQANGFAIGLETQTTADEGWWNETSVQLILFDLFDDAIDDNDTINLGFGPIHTVLTGPQKTTEAFTSIFSFIHYIVNGGHADSIQVNDLLAENNISPIDGPWGEDRGVVADDAPPGLDLKFTDPVYLDLDAVVNAGATETEVCVTNEGTGGEFNKLGNRRFGEFTPAVSGTYQFFLNGNGSSVDDSDPDIYIFEAGELVFSATDFSSSDDPAENPDLAETGDQTGIEFGEFDLQQGVRYTVDLHDWFNIDNDDSTGGEVCLELTVTGP